MAWRTLTTITSQPPARLLTSLAACYAQFNIASSANDAFLTAAIARNSRAIAQECNRLFGVAGIQDVLTPDLRPHSYRGNSLKPLVASHWPIVPGSPDVTLTQNFGDGTTVTLAEGSDFIADLELGELARQDSTTYLPRPWEQVPTTIAYTAGHAITGEAWTVPGTPYQITAAQPKGPFQADLGVKYANGTALTKVTGTPSAGQYALVTPSSTQAPGTYQFAAADAAASILISYAYIPADIEDACLRMIFKAWQTRLRDPTLRVEETPNLGRREYWISTGTEGNFTPDILDILDNYRVPMV
jgi:hypothetical protein